MTWKLEGQLWLRQLMQYRAYWKPVVWQETWSSNQARQLPAFSKLMIKLTTSINNNICFNGSQWCLNAFHSSRTKIINIGYYTSHHTVLYNLQKAYICVCIYIYIYIYIYICVCVCTCVHTYMYIYIYIYIYIQWESVNLNIVYPANPSSDTLLTVTDLAPL